jgi:hypothetical protein
MTTFEARVGFTADSEHLSIITFASLTSVSLPLPLCSVELEKGEVFMVAGQDKTEYFGDLWEALRFADSHGVGRKPGAITILTPCQGRNGIPAWNVSQVHERAIAKA